MPKTKLQKDKAVAAQIEAKVKRIKELERCLELTKDDLDKIMNKPLGEDDFIEVMPEHIIAALEVQEIILGVGRT